MLKQRFDSHGGGGGGGGSELPQFAKDIASILIRGPAEYFEAQNGDHGLGSGVFGDILAGYQAGSAQDLFGGLMDLVGRSGYGGRQFADQAWGLSDRGIRGATGLNDMSAANAVQSGNLGQMWGNFLGSSVDAGQNVNQLLGQRLSGPGGLFDDYRGAAGSLTRTPGIGEAGRRALAAAENVGPDSELYKSTLSFLTPQVRSAFSSRGMGSSGAALGAEGDQARQLADSFAQRANAERNAFLNTAAGSEAANASFQGALNNAIAGMYGANTSGRASAYGNQLQAGLGMVEAPGRIFSTLQGGLGQGIQNLGTAAGQYLIPMQMNQAGLAGFNAGNQTPVNMQQMLYNYFRSPQTQMLGLPSSTGQEQERPPRNGLFGQMLGFDKGS